MRTPTTTTTITVGQRVRHASTGELGTVREVLNTRAAFVAWEATAAGVAWLKDLRDATPVRAPR